nr:GTP-binding protein [Saccharofermentans sp.]
MDIKRRKPVTMITGYLGSGKTTVLNELLKSQSGERLAIIVNDLGSINIDASLLKQNSVFESESQMIEMTNGCICCTLQDAFMKQIEKLSKDDNVDSIIVEASGVSNPAAIAYGFLNYQQINGDSGVYLDSIVTVADAYRLYTEFIDDMIANAEEREEDPDIINLVMDQIEFCNIVLLSKCDLLDREQIDELKGIIRTFQNEAQIYETVNGVIDPDKIFSGQKFDYDKVLHSSALERALEREAKMEEAYEDDYGISSFVFKEKRPFDYDRFLKLVSEDFPPELIRGKG